LSVSALATERQQDHSPPCLHRRRCGRGRSEMDFIVSVKSGCRTATSVSIDCTELTGNWPRICGDGRGDHQREAHRGERRSGGETIGHRPGLRKLYRDYWLRRNQSRSAEIYKQYTTFDYPGESVRYKH